MRHDFLRKHALLLVIILSGGILRITSLNLPVSYDEAYTYIAFVRQDVWGILSDYSLPNNHILNSLLIKLSTNLLGNHPWSVRIPALMAGLAAILVVYALGKRLFNHETALTASALVAWLPAIIRYDTAARGYSLVSVFTLLAWLMGWLALQKNDWRYWLGISMSVALGAFAIPTMALPAGGLYLWVLGEALLRGEKRTVVYLRWLASTFFAGLLTLGLYVPVLLVSGWRKLLANGFVEPVEREIYFSKVLWRQLGATWDLWNLDMPLALAVLIILGMILSLVFSRRIAATRLHLAVPMLIWIALYLILRRPNAFDRFWSFILAPAMLWASVGWLSVVYSLKLGRFYSHQIVAVLSVFVLGWVTLLSLPNIQQNWNKLSNVEAMAIELKKGLQSDDMVLVGYPNDASSWYYLERLGVDDKVWNVRPNFGRAFVVVSAYYEQTPERVIRDNKLDPALFDLTGATKLGRIGFLEAYLIMPAPSEK